MYVADMKGRNKHRDCNYFILCQSIYLLVQASHPMITLLADWNMIEVKISVIYC